MRPLTPQALGPMRSWWRFTPEGAEVVFGTDCLLLAGVGVVLVPTSNSYRLEGRGGDLRLLVVAGTRLSTGADPQRSEHAGPVGGDEEAGHDGDAVGQEQPTEEEQKQDQPQMAGEEVDVHTLVAVAPTRFTAAAGRRRRRRRWRRRTNAGAVTRHRTPWSRTRSRSSWGQKKAREVGPQELGVAAKAGP